MIICSRYCSEGEKKTFSTLALVTFGLDNYSLLLRRPVFAGYIAVSLTSTHWIPVVIFSPYLWQPKMSPEFARCPLRKPISGWEPLGWSESRAFLLTRTVSSKRDILIIWLGWWRWSWDKTSETRKWTQQYLGGQTHCNCPVLTTLT